MTDPNRLRDQLAAIYEMKFKRQGKTLADLAQALDISKSYASLYLNGKLAVPSPKLVARVRGFVKRNSVSPGDGRLLVDIMRILDRADDSGSILAALLRSNDGD